MMVGHGTISAKAHGRAMGGPSLAGADLATLQTLRQKYGDGPHSGINEISDIMSTLVYPLFTDKDWQYCTINMWLNGVPSEDDLSWKAKFGSEMLTLEEQCGDHSFLNQYDAAFDDFADKGAPKEVIDWLRQKGKTTYEKKIKLTEKEGAEAVKKGVEAAKKSVNPFENPWVVGGIAAAVVLLLLIKTKK
jgi:hypothetical protein